MDFRFFKSAPNAGVEWPNSGDFDSEPSFVFVCLERTEDPDANNHTGFDFYGAFGDGGLIDQWASTQPLASASKASLPSPVTFYPTPFNEA